MPHLSLLLHCGVRRVNLDNWLLCSSSRSQIPRQSSSSPTCLFVCCTLSRVQVVLNREHRREKPMPFCLQWLGNAYSLQSPDGLNQGCCRLPDSACLLVCFLGHLGCQAEEKCKMLMWLSSWDPKPTLGIWGLQPLQCWVQSVWWEDGHLIVCFYGIAVLYNKLLS